METQENVIKRCEDNIRYMKEIGQEKISEDLIRDVKALKNISNENYIKYGSYTKWELIEKLSKNKLLKDLGFKYTRKDLGF
jgi:uncharacterized protein CbrC (UPF0167 family)